MKNLVKLQHYYMPGELEREIGQFVEYYNNQRYHESLDNLTPADVYYGRDKQILSKREKIKKKTLKSRKKRNLKEPVLTWKHQNYPLTFDWKSPKGSEDIQSAGWRLLAQKSEVFQQPLLAISTKRIFGIPDFRYVL